MDAKSNSFPLPDALLQDITDYVSSAGVSGETARKTARYCLMDALGCAIAALGSTECRMRLGPIVQGAVMDNGARVPGTDYRLEPVRASFNIGCMIRWLDYNDTWLAAEWGHPSDNLGAILSLADYLSHNDIRPLKMRDVLDMLIKAYEIQGVLALENSFNQIGLDHVILVRVASCAVASVLLGCSRNQTINALSNAWLDGGALRTYRHAPNTGWRKSWAAGDAAARGVQHALMASRGEMGCPTVLSTPKWGFYDVQMRGQPFRQSQPFGTYVIENILFKIGYPVEFHAHTAVECALKLHDSVKARLDLIERVELSTQEAASRIIDKTGPLHNPADRDHCLQYAVAVGLIFGELTSHHYEDEIAAGPRIDGLRAKMQLSVDPRYTADYLNAAKRSIANAVTVHYRDGTIDHCEIEYPLGHRRRREEGLPLLIAKFRQNLHGRYRASWIDDMTDALLRDDEFEEMPVSAFVDRWVASALERPGGEQSMMPGARRTGYSPKGEVTDMTETDYFQKFMPGDLCFGCGGANPDGMQIKSYWAGDDCVCIWQPEPKHQGWAGLTCGGIIATLIDCHCMASAMATAIRNEERPLGSAPHYRFATGALNIRYLKPTPIDRPLELRAWVTDVSHGRKYRLLCDLFSDGVKTVEAEVIAFLVYRSDQAGAGDSLFGGAED